MKKLNLFIGLMVLISGKIFAQGMMPPEAIKSPLLESMLGTWVSEPYDMMGSKMTDVVTQSMILNGQFMEIDIKSTADNNAFVYEAKGIISPAKDGSFTGWFFDIFGKDGITTYTGTTNGNTLQMKGTSKMGTETRDISVNGNIMLHAVTYKMKTPDGKEMPEQIMNVTYNKQN